MALATWRDYAAVSQFIQQWSAIDWCDAGGCGRRHAARSPQARGALASNIAPRIIGLFTVYVFELHAKNPWSRSFKPPGIGPQLAPKKNTTGFNVEIR